jgi:hypothetical protein
MSTIETELEIDPSSRCQHLLPEFSGLVDIANFFVDPNPGHIIVKAIDFIINWGDRDLALLVDKSPLIPHFD